MPRVLILTVLASILLLASVGCRRSASAPVPVIEGHVVDNFGRPIQGATISIRDSEYRAVTDPQGNFSLAFAPGAFSLAIRAPNCVPWLHDFQITQSVRYPLGTKILLRVPSTPNETVVVGAEQGYRVIPQVEFDRRVVTPSQAYSHHCAEFSMRHEVPVLRGATLFLAVPDRNFQLAQVVNQHVATEPFLSTVGACPNGVRRVDIRFTEGASRVFLFAEPPSGTYCIIRANRFDPNNVENRRGYCFQWTQDVQVRWGAVMTNADAPGLMGQTEQDNFDDARPDDGDLTADCLRNGVILCTEACYRVDRRWPDPDNPAEFFRREREAGECNGP